MFYFYQFWVLNLVSEMREKELIECGRMHIWTLKTQWLPGPLSRPQIPCHIYAHFIHILLYWENKAYMYRVKPILDLDFIVKAVDIAEAASTAYKRESASQEAVDYQVCAIAASYCMLW